MTACWSCQFGRGAWSLEEVGLLDPRGRAPVKDDWDGLGRLLARPSFPIVAPAARPSPSDAASEIPDIPPPMPRRSRLSDADWFAALDSLQPASSSRLTGFVDGCADLGVSWSLNEVLIVRMAVGDATLNVMGVQRDGLVEIPWSIGGAKDAFKGFAETLAAAIPGAIVYETLKFWRVSKPGKERVTVLELLDAASALRRALEELRSDLLAGP